MLLAVGTLAGAMNALAGGGSFVTLPALILAGVPSTVANATSTVALFPGALASAWTLRRDFAPFPGVATSRLLAASLAGGLIGAILLLLTPSRHFDLLVPWLLLLGAVAFAWGGAAGRLLRRQRHPGPGVMLAGQGLLAVYGGYFGGAVGIMMMALWGIWGYTELRAVNGAKSLFVGATNAVAVLCFIVAGQVRWGPGLALAAGAVAGGWLGARLSQRLEPRRLRKGVVLLNFLMAGAFFWRTYG